MAERLNPTRWIVALLVLVLVIGSSSWQSAFGSVESQRSSTAQSDDDVYYKDDDDGEEEENEAEDDNSGSGNEKDDKSKDNGSNDGGNANDTKDDDSDDSNAGSGNDDKDSNSGEGSGGGNSKDSKDDDSKDSKDDDSKDSKDDDSKGNNSGRGNDDEDGDEGGQGGNDQDGDGVKDAADNCVAVANADQKDRDKDGIGDACDSDTVLGRKLVRSRITIRYHNGRFRGKVDARRARCAAKRSVRLRRNGRVVARRTTGRAARWRVHRTNPIGLYRAKVAKKSFVSQGGTRIVCLPDLSRRIRFRL